MERKIPHTLRGTLGGSPRIRDLRWGRIELDTGEVFKDAKLYPGGGREWDWRETGTRHVPGIQPADVEELLAHEPEVVILSRGHLRALQVRPETLERLERSGVEVHVLPTRDAVDLYNRLAGRRRVAGLFHSTC